jgi:hypothetical protein
MRQTKQMAQMAIVQGVACENCGVKTATLVINNQNNVLRLMMLSKLSCIIASWFFININIETWAVHGDGFLARYSMAFTTTLT